MINLSICIQRKATRLLRARNWSCFVGLRPSRRPHYPGCAHVQMEQGQWYDDPVTKQRKAVSQFHEVVGFFGSRWLQYFAQLLTAISLLGTGIAQVRISYISPHCNKDNLVFVSGF